MKKVFVYLARKFDVNELSDIFLNIYLACKQYLLQKFNELMNKIKITERQKSKRHVDF